MTLYIIALFSINLNNPARSLKEHLLSAEEPLQGPGIKKGGDVWALVIKSVKAADAGLYMCELNTEPPVRTFHKLTG